MFRTTSMLVSMLLAGWLTLYAVAAQEALSPQEMRYLVLETEVALANNAQIGHYPFKIETQNNAIVLSGEVPNDAARLVAERTARHTIRDYDVKFINKIRVIVPEAEPAPPGKPTPFDEEQMAKVRSLIDESFSELAPTITVSFDTQPMPTIVLEGLIPTYEQKLELSRFIRRNFKDLPVVNNMRVRRVFEGDKALYATGPRDAERAVEPRRRTRTTTKANGNGVNTVVTMRHGDVEIAKQLGATLRADPVIKNCEIELRVDDGVAWLAGRVESPGQKVRAIKLASVQPGVRYVVNQLEIKPVADEAGIIKVNIPEPDDTTVYVQRYLASRMPEFADADVHVVDRNIEVLVASDAGIAEDQLLELESRLKRLPELRGYVISIRQAKVEKN